MDGVDQATASAHAGFPLTDAQLGRSFAVTSAHDPGSIDWAAFRGVDTLVLLMSGRSLPAIVDGLVSSGWSPDTPVRYKWFIHPLSAAEKALHYEAQMESKKGIHGGGSCRPQHLQQKATL